MAATMTAKNGAVAGNHVKSSSRRCNSKEILRQDASGHWLDWAEEDRAQRQEKACFPHPRWPPRRWGRPRSVRRAVSALLAVGVRCFSMRCGQAADRAVRVLVVRRRRWTCRWRHLRCRLLPPMLVSMVMMRTPQKPPGKQHQQHQQHQREHKHKALAGEK